MTEVAAVVCTYTSDRAAHLERAIRSLRSQTRPLDEMVVVVDHNEGLAEVCRRAFPDVRVVPNRGRPGLSDSRNSGVAATRAELVLFLDDDAVASPYLVATLAQELEAGAAGAGGAARPVWETGRPPWFPDEFDWVVGCSYRGLPVRRSAVRNLLGSNMAFRRAVLERVGGFRPDLGRVGRVPLGCEETELCLRIAARSGPEAVVYRPDAGVDHAVGPDRARWGYFLRRCWAEGRSKASVAAAHPSGALGTERRYVGRVLSAGVVRHLAASLRGDPSGAARAGAIVAGLATTTAGFLTGRLRIGREGTEPMLLVDVDPADPPARIDGGGYRKVRLLLRPAGVPSGTLEMDLGRDGLRGDTIRAALEGHFPPPTEPPTRRAPSEVSVVVATRHRPDALRRCLRALLASTVPPREIVVVENTSRPSSARLVVEEMAAGPAPVRYVREPVPGLARAHNTGLAHTTAPLVAFTDDDVVVDPGWVGAVADGFAIHPGAGCVTGLIYPLRLDHPTQARMERVGFTKGYRERVFRSEETADRLWPLAVGVCGSGANMAFRREALAAIGGFDPRLGAGTRCRGGDDLAAFFDVLEAGWEVVYRPEALVRHDHGDGSLFPRAFSYGTGLGAHLARAVARHPATLRQVAARRGGPRRSRRGGLPVLPWLAGLAWGPVAYAVSRPRPVPPGRAQEAAA